MVKIWIDAGHGGHDSGAVGNGLQEKNIVVEIARQLNRILSTEYENVQTDMSRMDDTFVELAERARRANAWGADAFISIHCNSGGGRGFESYRHTNANAGDNALQYALHTNLAAFYRRHGTVDRGKKAANFAVLRLTNMPSVLTENLFMDNVEIKKFNDLDFLIGAARAHAEGAAQYFNLKKISGANQAPAPVSMVADEPASALAQPQAKKTTQGDNEVIVPYPGHPIKRGSRGKDVERIQRAVKVTPDGIFGPETEAAVKAYQSRHGLVPDGIVGPKTWNVMF